MITKSIDVILRTWALWAAPIVERTAHEWIQELDQKTELSMTDIKLIRVFITKRLFKRELPE